ncbi:3-oxoacyl-ACP reductase [Pueribacillus theae]|uniref:3-oxoacyl-ACP reductase n=1 Tax=Pueribacillus theae TaxID=2171751 RepID=A0A2U1K133_9BACI|nr:3-oxoacyl-ACP reductase family protein [Pueribacillus theae]PWA11226.1 3-oxoacyl-ACP reductase [Pueribacillus theae]
MKLKNKKALVTGSASGIGRAIALAYAKEGADLALNYFDRKEDAQQLKELIDKEYGVKTFLVEANISDESQVQKMVDKTIEELGSIDILVNAAGILTQVPMEKMDINVWDQMININLRGTFLCTRFVLPHMIEKRNGRIISIASQLAQIGGVELTHYCAAKAGIIGMTKSLAREVGEFGITVNCIAPGTIETDLIKGLDENWKQQKQKELVISRFGKPEEVAPSAVFLASDPDGNLYTGQTLGPNMGDVML